MVIYLYVKKQRNQGDMIIGVQTQKDFDINQIIQDYNQKAVSPTSIAKWLIDENEGTVIIDLISPPLNGTIYNGTWENNYLVLNGSTSYVYVGDASKLHFGTDSFSISFWIYQTSSYGDILGKYQVGANRWGISARSSTLMQFFQWSDTGQIGSYIFDVGSFLNDWQHFVFIINRTDNKVYVYRNAILKKVFSLPFITASFTNTTALTLGKYYSNPQWGFWGGKISNLQFFNKVLSQDEINMLYYNFPVLDARLNVLALMAWRELYYMGYKTRQKVVLHE